MEQRIQSEEARSKEVKDQLNASRARLLEVETIAFKREASLSELVLQIEEHKDKNENLVLQLSELATEKQRLVESGQNQQDSLTRQVRVLEEHVSELKESLAEREAELRDLRSEFGSYKVRAQSVLRQKARLDDGSSSFIQEDHLEEMALLKQTAEILRSKLEDTSSKLQTLSVENSAVQEDRARVLQRCQEMLDTVQDLRNQNAQLHAQLEDSTIAHREALRSQKLQADTLNQCYKQQLKELEEKLQMETSTLMKQLQNVKEQLHGTHKHSSIVGEVIGHVIQPIDSNMVLSTPSKHASPHWNSSTEGFIPVQSAVVMSQQDLENKLEITLLKREEGEGSESIDSASPHLSASQEHRTELIPLDKLLSSQSDDDNSVPTVNISPGAELGQIKEQLVVSECRIRHLTGLLSEAERDLAKLTQQNQVLKEEIRRQQRSVEREQHAQNFEYLKNVILKFVTLQGGDERTRLVPVLNTILKLSPEETNQLNIIAKGGPDLQGGGRGWGSYLHLWAGTH
ncbi:GRIP and coiled-coil domain-containing protein 2 [Zootermopsis nevadensis]|uniref:GRIP and coiled-coil domain-containing protein 2 n=2 Tax=Zootermopsis nevadensis TaxID=136037 RepID=A0A067R2L1_ZOONE|nr:GRIP and coiled-coil domain-containing protein 2 [Zootermopsis nevadensis]